MIKKINKRLGAEAEETNQEWIQWNVIQKLIRKSIGLSAYASQLILIHHCLLQNFFISCLATPRPNMCY